MRRLPFDSVLKHYNARDDSFASTWQEQSVGCQGCSGPGQAREYLMKMRQTNPDDPRLPGLQ